MKKNAEEMSTRSLIHSLSRNRYNLSQQRYTLLGEKEIIISRYNEVFKELHKRGHCNILNNGIEELNAKINYEKPLKEETLETLGSIEQNILTLYFGLKGTAYCKCKICEMLNLTPYEVQKHLVLGIKRLRHTSRISFNNNPYPLD